MQGTGTGLLPAQAVAAEATAAGPDPREHRRHRRAGWPRSGVEVVSDEPHRRGPRRRGRSRRRPPALDDAGPAASADLVRVYLREIGRVPLLTAADEVDLAKRVEAGVFAAEKLDHETGLPPELRRDLRAIVERRRSAPRSG